MPVKQTLIQLLDTPPLRPLLGWEASRRISAHTGKAVQVFHDGLWMHRIDGVVFPDGPRFEYQVHTTGHWSTQAERYLSDAADYWYQHYRPRPGDVVVDIGAGRGEDVFAFSRDVGPTGRVIAVEAHPASFALLEAFCRHNGLHNVTPVQAAIMDAPGTIHMAEYEQWESHAVAADPSQGAIEVPALTLPALCRQLGIETIDFLKMNIEGAERYALPGMAPLMDRIRTICVACHDFRADRGEGEQYRSRAFTEQFLQQHGFRVTRRSEDPREYVRDHLFGLR